MHTWIQAVCLIQAEILPIGGLFLARKKIQQFFNPENCSNNYCRNTGTALLHPIFTTNKHHAKTKGGKHHANTQLFFFFSQKKKNGQIHHQSLF